MAYQQSPKTITVTKDGQPVHFEANYATTPKSVAVYVGAEYVGTWSNRTAAREALGLIDVPAKKRENHDH